jgi:hypothetical protein
MRTEATVFFVEKGPAADATDTPQPVRLIVQHCDEDEAKDDQFFTFFQVMEHRWNEICGGKTCPNSTLSITNPTWTDPGSNLGLRRERPATNRLSHGTAISNSFLQNFGSHLLNTRYHVNRL